MAILKTQSYPTNLGKAPATKSSFIDTCNTDRIDWTDKMITSEKDRFSPGYGNTQVMPSTKKYGSGQVIDSIWQGDVNRGFDIFAMPNSSSNDYDNIELKVKDQARWMPAAIFNGCAFEVYQSSAAHSSIYVTGYALVYMSAVDQTYRYVGNNLNDGHDQSPYKGYRYAKFDNETYIDQIRAFGNNWLFCGIVLAMKNGSGSGEMTSVKMWNLKMYHKCKGSTSTDHRIFAPKFKPTAYRNEPLRGVAFS